jgi:hypothetical protein
MNSARDDAKQQKSQDPDADSSFLIRSNGELNDPELSIKTPKEIIVTQNDYISFRNQPLLPTGENIDSKNTLQTFHTRSGGTARSTPDALRQQNQNTSHTITQMDPTLPSDYVIDSKNTLQSIRKPTDSNNDNTKEAVPPCDANAVSSNPPTLPSGEVIDSKNTLRSFNTRPSVPSPAPNADVPNAQVENVYIAELVTVIPRRKSVIVLSVIGALTILVAIVIAVLCSSGKCGSRNMPSEAMNSTTPPTSSPTVTSTGIDLALQGVVSEFINNISYFGQSIYMNGTNAESRALKWISNSTEGLLFTDDESALLDLSSLRGDDVSFRICQRYALATLWFQQADENGDFVNSWETDTGWLEDANECLWFGIKCENGSVTEISFYNYTTKVGNMYIGSIPPDIGLLTSLQTFVMNDNELVGTIPESIGKCSSMRRFDLQGVNFGGFSRVTGTLPSSIGQWTNITYFDVELNEIAGTIPESTKNWVKIRILDVSNNQMTGSIPSFIGQWRSITGLYLSSNKFSKTIPEEIGNLGNVIDFFIMDNLLTGTLPPLIGRLTSLESFNVDRNSIAGTIPPSIRNWTQIKRASFYSNDFTGTMPMEICASIQDDDMLISDCNVSCSCCTSCQ